MNSLHSIGEKYQTDKATYHMYLDFYEKYLNQDDIDRFLEIGVQAGNSMKMWREWLKSDCIVEGWDILECDPIPGVDIRTVDQLDRGQTFKKSIRIEGDTVTFSPSAANFIISDKNAQFDYGKIMNAYFNMDWINNTVKSLISTDTGEVSMLKLLRALCDGWNKATGHYNRLDIQIDPDTNEAKFIDEVSIPSRDRSLFLKNKDTAYFLTYRSLPGTGSTFLKNLDFTTQIPHNFATLITIGSTAQGYVLGADATALSRMNAGLEDRVKPEIISPGSEQDKNTSLEEKYKSSIVAYDRFISSLGIIDGAGGTSRPTWNSTAISNYSSLQPQFLEYTQASQSRSNNNFRSLFDSCE